VFCPVEDFATADGRIARHFQRDPDTVGVNAQIQSMMDDLETYMQLGPGTVKRETRAAEVAG